MKTVKMITYWLRCPNMFVKLLNLKPEEGTYKEVQEITISSDTEGEIYYTTDGTDPTAKTGKKYKEPILLEKRRNNGDSRYCCKYERDSERSDISDIYD